LTAIGSGTFAGMRRPPDGGRGLDGVIRHADGYLNPAIDILDAGLPEVAR
jgi:beta-lysine 5,6-aminomutase alpha subunit